MRINFLFVLLVLLGGSVKAQNPFSEASDSNVPPAILGRVHVSQDFRLEKMLSRHIEKNKWNNGIKGYRVEIFFGSDIDARKRAESKKVEFLSKFPEIAAYVKYEAPNFRLRVGDFRTKNEALKLYKKVKTDFPVAFIVSDDINFPMLKPLQYE